MEEGRGVSQMTPPLSAIVAIVGRKFASLTPPVVLVQAVAASGLGGSTSAQHGAVVSGARSQDRSAGMGHVSSPEDGCRDCIDILQDDSDGEPIVSEVSLDSTPRAFHDSCELRISSSPSLVPSFYPLCLPSSLMHLCS